MEQDQNELISRLMDDDLDLSEHQININDEAVQSQWKRYQIMSDIVKTSQTQTLILIDVSEAVSKALDLEPEFETQPSKIHLKQKKSFFNLKFMHGFQNVGMVAAVAVAILTGIQFFNQTEQDDYSVINTIPTGIKAVPVGGLKNVHQDDVNQANESQYNQIRFLMREYELQKRLNTAH